MAIRYRTFLFAAILVIAGCGLLQAQSDSLGQEGKLNYSLRDESIFEITGSNNLGGSIKVESRPGSGVEVFFTKSARAESRSQAARYLDLIDLKLDPRGEDRVVLEILSPSDSPWEGTNNAALIDVNVYLPENMSIVGDIKFLGIAVVGPFDGVRINAQYSAVSIERINGDVDVNTSFSPVALSNLEGSIKVETRYGPISASDIIVSLGSAIFKTVNGAVALANIQGPVEAYTSYSTISASNISADEGSIVFRTTYSPIEIENVRGELICETTFSQISMKGVSLTHGQSKIETSYSPIEAEFERINDSHLIINNSYNNISLSLPPQLSSLITADVDQGGRIHASNLPVIPVYLDVTRLEGYLGDADGGSRIEAKISGVGAITIEGR